jgi:hypothetical protein
MGTGLDPLGFNLIGLLSHLQAMARVPLLGAWFLATGLTQTVGMALTRFLQTIAGRRLIRVVTVFVQVVFQRLDSIHQLEHNLVEGV